MLNSSLKFLLHPTRKKGAGFETDLRKSGEQKIAQKRSRKIIMVEEDSQHFNKPDFWILYFMHSFGRLDCSYFRSRRESTSLSWQCPSSQRIRFPGSHSVSQAPSISWFTEEACNYSPEPRKIFDTFPILSDSLSSYTNFMDYPYDRTIILHIIPTPSSKPHHIVS